MRKNLPIINEQVQVPENYRMISRTDLQGTILEANLEFIEVSGYSKDELIGQPHNILRHPDVPEVVFKDLWQTLKSGSGWTQIVKNRTKDGRHYWVKANVAPVFEGEKIIGYTSVRKFATLEEIKLATDAYQKISQGKVIIKNGHILSPLKYKLSKLNPFRKASLVIKVSVLSAFLILVGVLAVSSIAITKYQLEAQNTENKRVLEIQNSLNNFIERGKTANLNLALSIASNSDVRFSLEQNINSFAAKNALENMKIQFEKQNLVFPRVFIHTPRGNAFLRSWTDKSGDSLIDFRHSVNHIRENQQQPFSTFELGRSGVPFRTLTPIFGEMSQEYIGSLEIMMSTNDFTRFFKERGEIYFSLLTAESLKTAYLVKSDHLIQDYAVINSKYMDSEKAKYLSNINLAELFEKQYIVTHDNFIVSFPIFSLDNSIIGYHVFIEDSTRLDDINSVLFDEAIQTIIKAGILMFLLAIAFLILILVSVIRPIKRLAFVIKKATSEGDLSLRGNANHQDEIGQLARSYNSQMQTMQVIMGESGRMMGDLSQGNFKTTTSVLMNGDFAVMTNGLIQATTTMEGTFTEIKSILFNIRRGNFSYISNLKTSGEFKEAIEQAQVAMVILQGVFFEVNTIMSQVSHGNFSGRITAEAEGELEVLKNNINESLNQLEEAISETTNVMISQGSGNLTSRIESNFEGSLGILKDGVNNSIVNMSSLMLQSNYSIYKLSEGASSIAQDIHDLSNRTQQQAASVEETAASMEEITSTVQQTANNAIDANNMASSSLKEAGQANRVVQDTILSINDINKASHKISEITTLIDSIAFQTNLLALNAAVEAARAGEHGRGFAVVAGEVRNLAGKSAEAAKDIRILIDDTVKKVSKGAALAQESGQALEVINNSIAQISGLVSEITQTTSEQAKGVDLVNEALTSIDHTTQENYALVEKASKKTAEMRQLGGEVLSVVKNFKIDADQVECSMAMKTGEFAFANARRNHRQLKSRLTSYLKGMKMDFNEEIATNHRKCKLGEWFFSEAGQQYAHLPEMQEVDKHHAGLHVLIKEIIEHFKSNDIESMEDKLSQMDAASDLVIDWLNKAELAVKKLEEQASNSVIQANKLAESVVAVNSGSKTKNSVFVKKTSSRSIIKNSPKEELQSKKVVKSIVKKPELQTPAPVQPKQDNGDEWGEF